jgi:hypothetical protein
MKIVYRNIEYKSDKYYNNEKEMKIVYRNIEYKSDKYYNRE